MRALILRKCDPEHLTDVRTIFEQQPFGELEQLVTRYLLEIARETAGERPEADDVSLLEPSIERWRVDLTTFAVDVVLAAGTASPESRRLEFMERDGGEANIEEPGFKEFLDNRALSGSATRGGNRLPPGTRIQARPAYAPLLLSRAAEPQGSAQLSSG